MAAWPGPSESRWRHHRHCRRLVFNPSLVANMRCYVLLVGLSLPQLAWSHSPIAGIGQFYGGLLHPLMVPAHTLTLTVFALLIGQSGIRAMRLGYPPFMLCLAVGLVLAGFDIS